MADETVQSHFGKAISGLRAVQEEVMFKGKRIFWEEEETRECQHVCLSRPLFPPCSFFLQVILIVILLCLPPPPSCFSFSKSCLTQDWQHLPVRERKMMLHGLWQHWGRKLLQAAWQKNKMIVRAPLWKLWATDKEFLPQVQWRESIV